MIAVVLFAVSLLSLAVAIGVAALVFDEVVYRMGRR